MRIVLSLWMLCFSVVCCRGDDDPFPVAEVKAGVSGQISEDIRYFFYVADTDWGPFARFRIVNVSNKTLNPYWKLVPPIAFAIKTPSPQNKSNEQKFYFRFSAGSKPVPQHDALEPGDSRSFSVELITPVTRKSNAERFRDLEPELRGSQGFDLDEFGIYSVILLFREGSTAHEVSRLDIKYGPEGISKVEKEQK